MISEGWRGTAYDKPNTALRVLVVEDDCMIGMLLAEMLEAMGHDPCAIEATEADAVTAVARYRPDLMIVDAWLGDGSGLSDICLLYTSGKLGMPGIADRDL